MKSPPTYKAGRISGVEAEALKKHYDAEIAKGIQPYAAVVKVAKKGQRRVSILAGSLLCPWAAGMQDPEVGSHLGKGAPKKSTNGKTRAHNTISHQETPSTLASSSLCIISPPPPQSPEEQVFRALFVLSGAIAEFKERVAKLEREDLKEYARTGASLLLSLSPIPTSVSAPAFPDGIILKVPNFSSP